MFDSCIRDHASWTPRAPAVILPGRPVGYAEFNADIDRYGAALAALDITPTTGCVSIALADPYLQYVATAALSRLGVASAPANDDAADLRLTDRDAPPAPGQRTLLLTRDWTLAALAAESRPLPRRLHDPLAPGRVMLSSGATQAPRRVALSWRRLDQDAHAALREYCAGKLGTWIPLTGIDSMLGLALCMGAWSVGAAATNAIPMADLPHALETLPPGMLSLTPRHLREVLDALPAGFRPRPAWRIVSGGARLPRPVAREARLRLTPDIRLIYGATEVGTIALGHAADLEHDPGQIGIVPTGGVVEVLGDDGRALPDGQAGEIRVRGPRLAPGYVGDPDATAERFRDGWFMTGDRGLRLPAGHPLAGRLVLEGRLDERMNLAGVKLMPRDLEDPALACPGVRDAAAFAVPGADRVDRAWLAISAAPGFDRDSLPRHLAAYPDLPPLAFAWIDEIPRNAMGKVERTRLRDAVIAATRTD